MDNSSELIPALRPVVVELERMGVRYYVGGSVASTFYNAGRSTMDVDLAAELQESDVSTFVRTLCKEFYVNEAAVLDAVRRKSCFNLIYLATSFKVDVFISRRRPFDAGVFDRAIIGSLGGSPSLAARIASPEDIILLKMEWFRLGGEMSERQWRDIEGVTRLLGDRLDRDYLLRWAPELGLTDLVERLFSAT